ncbi:MAG TPA: aspartyl-tRNA synthetase [Bacillales bacterium]|nr:aspartyl-tRNA synthetase [Bacillales bacterium]
MKKKSYSKTIISLVIFIFTFYCIVLLLPEKSNSYKEPHEAIFADDTASNKDFLLIPANKLNGKALFFFIKDKNNLGAVYADKGIFGWKAGMLTWSVYDKEMGSDKLEDIHGHGGNLVFGLIRDGDEHLVKINGNNAKILNLAMLSPDVVKEFQLEGLYIWYFESDKPLSDTEIKLVNKTTGEELHSVDF